MNITYNPSAESFDIKPNGIHVKKYPDSLISYLYGNKIELEKSSGLSLPFEGKINEDYYLQDETGFPYINVFGTVKYHKSNFRNVNHGCIRFSVKKKDCNQDYSYQDFVGYKGAESSELGFKQGKTYSFVLNEVTNGNVKASNKISFTPEKDISLIGDVQDIIQKAIDNSYSTSVPYKPFKCEMLNGKSIRIRTNFEQGLSVLSRISINTDVNEDATRIAFLRAFDAYKNLDGVFSAPDNDTAILRLKELDSTNNEIAFIHKTDGKLYLVMYDDTSDFRFEKELCEWNWTNEEFIEFELNYDSSLCNFIVNGKVISSFEPVGFSTLGTSEVSSIIRSDSLKTDLVLVGKYNDVQGDAYCFNLIAIFDEKQHCGGYTLPSKVEIWEPENISAEYNYGKLSAYDDKTLDLETTGPATFYMYDGSTIMAKSDSVEDFKKKVHEIDYDPTSTLSFESADDIIFKVVFDSPESSLTKLEFHSGTPVYNEDDPYNFEDIFDWVRRECGAPQITCELTDEQIYDALTEAVAEYNKYRNYDKALSIESINNTESDTDLKRCWSEKEGTYFILPPNITEKDVIDIYFHPRYSSAWFGAGNDFMNNVMAQTFFSRAADMSTNAADYYIYRSSINDISNLIGTQISWRFYNNHLYITPNNLEWLDQFKVGIVYKQPLAVEEIRNSWQIKRYCLGRCMIILGMIRGTFANGIPAGDITIQLNSETLISNGKEMMNAAHEEMKKQQYPLFMIWS